MGNAISIGSAYKDQEIVGGLVDNTPIGNTTRSTGKFTSVDANAGVTSTSVTATAGINSTGATGAGIGYATGAGGTVTQATSKATAFTLSKLSGQITTAADALAAATIVSATWTNTAIAATDVVTVSHASGGTLGAYTINVAAGAGTATLTLRNNTAGSLSEALVISFAVIKAVSA